MEGRGLGNIPRYVDLVITMVLYLGKVGHSMVLKKVQRSALSSEMKFEIIKFCAAFQKKISEALREISDMNLVGLQVQLDRDHTLVVRASHQIVP